MFSLRTYHADVASHRHAFHQMVLPRAGVLEMEIEGRGGRVEHGRAAFVGAGERHAFGARGANRFVVLDLPASQFDARDESLLRRGFLELRPCAHLLLDGLGENLPRRAEASVAWARLLLDALRREPAGADRLHAVRRLLEAEPERRYDSLWLARLAGLSRAQFYRRFVAVYGTTPAALQRERRLALALARLHEKTSPIARIAGDVGYSEHSALTRALTRAYGTPPRRLRG